MVLDKIRTDGLVPALEAVRNKLDQPLPMGYCNVGVVAEVGAGVHGFAVGDRVASNGKHAEAVSVTANLCALVPEGVAAEDAAFTVLGGHCAAGYSLVQPTLGEAVVVTGLGLIGLVTVQLLRAQGCRVLAAGLWPGQAGDEPTLALAQIESMAYLRNQLLRDSDCASMDHSVELRTPLVDAHLLDMLTPYLGAFEQFPGKRLLSHAPKLLCRPR